MSTRLDEIGRQMEEMERIWRAGKCAGPVSTETTYVLLERASKNWNVVWGWFLKKKCGVRQNER